MGFGHRVYKNYDPRAKLIKRVADDVFARTGVDPKLEIALELERIALEDDYFVSRKLYPNVDFYSGIIYRAMGYPTDYFTVLFALGRLPGWLAQWEEMLSDPEQKIARPRQIYTGYDEREFVPLEQRGSLLPSSRRQRVGQSGERRTHVLRAARAHDDRDTTVAEQPRERQRGRVSSAFELLECVVHTVVPEVLIRAGAHRHPRALRHLSVAAVLSGQPAARERAERLEPDVHLRGEGKHVALDLTVEQRVRVLDSADVPEAEYPPELRRVDVAEPVGADLASRDELVEHADDFGHRHVGVPVVGEVEVDALDAEPPKARVDLPSHARRRQSVILALVHRVEGLRR